VSATDARDEIARFSSRGDAIDLAAPGVEVVQQTICNRGLDRCERFPGFSGTSMAAPHVAGAAAMLVSLGVSQPDEVEARLKSSSRSRGTRLEERRRYGAGLLDAAAAVERVTFGHAAVRLIALAMGAWIAGRGRLRRSSLARPSFWLLALMTGPGLFFAAPWAMLRTSLAVELLARPFADWDLALDVNLHRWLPLAHVGVPLALVALAFGARRFRPAIAGVATGTAAYLVSVAVLGEAFLPFGRVALVLWCALHAAACLWIARVSLVEPA
jgi:serine protease